MRYTFMCGCCFKRVMSAAGVPRQVSWVLLLLPVQVARYFCTGDIEAAADWAHYALSVPRYTHFTSPIRRFPDIVVHRLLAAALERAGTRSNDDLAPVPQTGAEHAKSGSISD